MKKEIEDIKTEIEEKFKRVDKKHVTEVIISELEQIAIQLVNSNFFEYKDYIIPRIIDTIGVKSAVFIDEIQKNSSQDNSKIFQIAQNKFDEDLKILISDTERVF